MRKARNLDLETVNGFGQEWSKFTYDEASESELAEIFDKYFCLIDWSRRPGRALDMGCGSGRWDKFVAPLVDELVAVDASPEALTVAMRNVTAANVSFVRATPDDLPFPDAHFDLIFSLGVLHHVPHTADAICSLAEKLRPGGVLLLYLYYAFDNRAAWYRRLWKVTDWARRWISRLPFFLRYALSQMIALGVYWPLARIARYLPTPGSWPLKFYANRSLYVMRTDALDRFGTKMEKRFTKSQIVSMLEKAGFESIRFSDAEPYWVCKGSKPKAALT